MYSRLCKTCQIPFTTNNKRTLNCSISCGNRMNSKLKTVNCQHCNKLFKKKENTQKFCSRSCSASYTNIGKRVSDDTKTKLSRFQKEKLKNGTINLPNGISTYCPVFYCKICSKIFTSKDKKSKQQTCSKQCGFELNRINLKIGLKKPGGGLRERSGRGKSGWYRGYFCNSTYELAYVIYNIDHDIKFERNTKGYTYFYPERNDFFKYYPDFSINDGYVEIKGYETKLNNYKLSGVTDKTVTILYKKDLKYIFDYVQTTYSITIDKLYELYEDHKPKFEKVCLVCNEKFTTDRDKKLLCSRVCAGRYVATKNKLRNALKINNMQYRETVGIHSSVAS